MTEIPRMKSLKDIDGDELAAFLPGEAPGAISNGSKIEKINSKGDDGHRDGSRGKVLSSHGPIPPDSDFAGVYGYFIEWDDLPGIPIFIAGNRIRRVTE